MDFATTPEGWVYARGRQLFWRPPPGSHLTGDRPFGGHEADIVGVFSFGHQRPHSIYTFDKAGQCRVWTAARDGFALTRAFQRPPSAPAGAGPDATLRWFFAPAAEKARLWDLQGVPGARPLSLRRSGSWYGSALTVHPLGHWLAAARMAEARVDFWPLQKTYPAVVDGCNAVNRALAFTADGRWLATICGPAVAKALHLWPVPGSGKDTLRKLEFAGEVPLLDLRVERQGRYIFGTGFSRAAIVPLDGSAPRVFPLSASTMYYGGAISPSGRRVATAYGFGSGEKKLHVWNVESGVAKSFDIPALVRAPAGEQSAISAFFTDESTLYTAGAGGLRRWSLEDGTSTLVAATPGRQMWMAAVPGGRRVVTRLEPYGNARDACSGFELRDLGSGKAQPLPAFGDCVSGFAALSADGEVVAAGSRDGTVRVGPLSGEPHLLIGHVGPVGNVAISPDLRWVATAGEDNTLRLWPMPDLSKPPLHTLPREELIARLHSLTNLRAVRAPAESIGWRIDVGPFPGWRDVPTW